ncbi:hypothetical protein BJX68DRAFT_23369 [Aspergillus pseudodeflectus]|uniref:Peptidase S8/S53 domain-containing protein n=1 Tax=Aspergillus pseudodeflectus TaxID=176178 RepID=A0ABR4KS76_9EURO
MANVVGNRELRMSSPSDEQSEEPSSFEELGIRPEIIAGLQSMHIMKPFNCQTRFLRHLLNNSSEDLIGIAHPGTGKTTAYCISILQRLDLSTELAQNTPQAVVLVHTARPARHVADVIRTIGRFLHGLTVSISTDRHGRNTRDQAGCSVIVRSLLTESAWEFSRGDAVRMFIIDDVQQGRFQQCERIKRQLPTNTQVALFFGTPLTPGSTATLAPNARAIQISPRQSFIATKHLAVHISKDDSKLDKLLNFFNVLSIGPVIIFVQDPDCMSDILRRLLKEDFPAAILRGADGNRALDDFVSGRIKIMIAHPSSAHGLGVSNASHVFIYDIPKFVLYIHCLGRADYRRSSLTFSFVGNQEGRGMLKSLENYYETKIPLLEWKDLDQLESAIETIIRPPKGRLRLLGEDEASSNETSSLMESAVETITPSQRERPGLLKNEEERRNETSPLMELAVESNILPQKERPPLRINDKTSSNEASSLMHSIHSSIPEPQIAGYSLVGREIPGLTTRQSRRPKSKSTLAGQRRRQTTTEASVVPSWAKRSTNFTFGTNIIEESDSGKEASYKTFQYLHATVDRRLQHKERDERVRIAILDTGIDLSHEDFVKPRTKDFHGKTGGNPVKGELAQINRLKAYRNFCICDGNTEEETNVNDRNGHGTQVAGIILRLAPNADLYIARVCAGKNRADSVARDEDPFQEPQPSVVAKAVEWAIAQKVHLINLSLGYRHSDPVTMESLRASLDRARAHKIVVFAAASNEGLHEPVAWPASDLQYAIGVHSSTDAGKESDTTALPLRGSYNFMVVGERILSHWPTTNGGGFRLCTGSSFAAPVATAIAALILAFTWQARCKKEREKAANKVILDDLRTNSGMAKVLSRISKTRGDFHSISPQLFWEDYHDLEDPIQNESEARQHAWQIIEAALRV